MTVNPLPVVTVSPAATICAGQSATLVANGATTYSWSPSTTLSSSTGSSVTANPSSTTTYTVTGNLLGCTATAQSTVIVNPLPVVTVSPNSSICSGDSVVLTAGGANTYTWSPANELNIATGAMVVSHASAQITYTVTGTTNGCSSTAQVTVTVNPLPAVTFSPDNSSGCSPLLVQFTDNSVTTSGSAYLWNFGDNSTSTLQNPSHLFLSDGTFLVSLTVSSPAGCINSFSSTVTVNPNPVAAFLITPPSADVGVKIDFTNQSYSNIVSWNWNFVTGTEWLQFRIQTTPMRRRVIFLCSLPSAICMDVLTPQALWSLSRN
ncbi:MAG TPA: PKD domain-containing protein [Bacteroidia bacterium]|nr:PKD domain-containing protein [Bacteroidia bacterium]